MVSSWRDRHRLVYAHQGGAKEAPSSTLFAFERAVALGCHGLEMDVHRSADGRLVVCHDETVDATTPVSGVIADLDWPFLALLDNAHWFVEGFGGTGPVGHPGGHYPLRGQADADPRLRVASLHDVLEAFPHTFLNFDIKQSAPDVVPYEADLAEALRRFGRGDDVIVGSFHDSATARFRAFAPEFATSAGPLEVLAVGMYLAGQGPLPDLDPSLVALQVPTHFGEHRVVTHAFVEGAHDLGLAVHVWTIDEADEMRELLAMGVDAIITDRPSVALEVLAQG